MGWYVIGKPQRKGGGDGSDKSNAIVISNEKAGGKSDRMAIAFRIGDRVTKAMRWQKGDRIAIVRDGVLIGLRRVVGDSKEGFVLSQTSGSSLRFKFVNYDLMELIAVGTVQDPIIAGDVVVVCEAKSKGGKK
jgi:hypothetical protein